MDRKEALAELIAKVEAGDRSASLRNTPLKGYGGYYEGCLNGSLDAAKALHEEVLPGWWWKVIDSDPYYVQVGMLGIGIYAAQSDDPARAWLLAILRALYARETDT